VPNPENTVQVAAQRASESYLDTCELETDGIRPATRVAVSFRMTLPEFFAGEQEGSGDFRSRNHQSTGPLRRSSELVRNQAIVGKSRIEAALERCDRSVILLHNHHFPIAWTLDRDHALFHTQHQQYEPQLTHGKVSLDLTPKRDIHAESVRSDLNSGSMFSA